MSIFPYFKIMCFSPNRPSNSFQYYRIFCSRTGTSIPTTNFQYQAAQKSKSNPFLEYGLHGTSATSRMQRSQQFSNNLLLQLQKKPVNWKFIQWADVGDKQHTDHGGWGVFNVGIELLVQHERFQQLQTHGLQWNTTSQIGSSMNMIEYQSIYIYIYMLYMLCIYIYICYVYIYMLCIYIYVMYITIYIYISI